MSADSAVAIAWDLLKGAVTAIKRPIRYVMSSKSFAEGLQEEVQNLQNEVQRVNVLVERARNNVRKFHDVFTTWENKSGDALKEVRDLLGNFENATKICCYGTLPDPKCRYQFSRKAEGKIKVIRELAQKCSGFKELDDISFIDPTPGNVPATNSANRECKDVVQSTTTTASAFSASTSFVLGDDGVFESRAMMIQNIMDALANNINSVVGVYGMGGVGKSTLLVDVERIIKGKKSFDLVAKADVSENPDIKKIQGEIADALGLTEIKNKETTNGRAKLLHERLKDEEKKNKKVLIILDNLWKGLELKSVGIPCGRDHKVIGCKLLLTSRFRNVLQSEMSCDKAFALDGLKEKEAKILFERIVGEKVHNDEFRPLVDEALHRCAGLPLLLDAMAKQLKLASLPEWRDALKQIEWSTNEGISGVINKVLQLSYDHLESEDAKSLLQLCVAYGVSMTSIENLVRYGYGLGIFQKYSRMEEARDRMSTLIRTLQASSLLLDNEGTDGLKIHDLVHDFVAQSVLRNHPLLVLKDKDMSTTQLQNERLKSCSALCFPYIDIKELPKELYCPELHIFLLFNNNISLEIPDSFFNSMKKLAVLHLTSVCITHSPTPFQFLENLHTLCLQHCLLEDVAILGNLKGLQVLSCVNSNFQRLPKEIGQLTELRLLDLNYCSLLQMIEPGVLGRLIKLEELYMENSFNQWNPVEQTQSTNASLIELNHLKNLCTLHVSIPDPSALPEDLDVKKLTKYKIQIGNAQRWGKDLGWRILYLKLDPIIDVLRKGCIQSILNKTDDLFLAKLNGSEQSICALSPEGFPKLKHLLVEDSSSIQYILQCCSLSAFEMLESLLLIELNNLTEICYSHISSSKSFGKLKVIQVESCDKMEVLFPLSLLRALPQLEEIKVVSCKLMHGIVDVDDCGKAELQNLRKMYLHQFPNIKNFFTTKTTLSSSTSEDQVGTQIAFFNGQQVAFPNLENLYIKSMDNIEMIWHDQIPADSFSKLKLLSVKECKKLVNFAPSFILGQLLSLETLTAKACDSLEVVFKLQPLNHLDRNSVATNVVELISDEGGKEGHVVAFNQLKYMKLDGLTRLRCFISSGYTLMFPLLEDIIVNRCPKMKFFSEGPMEAPKLERVRVDLNELSTEYLYFWKGSLNTTIQNMFKEMVCFSY
ncbi:probable disease resistance protein At4g27220 [Eucalyptus grandis]|uniref:probable disease resistance protein At4g27220 n=1 Tax=Eucalyptus grandis TaxID=71139 RepID=UPI00192EB0D9|nr:probable disease resistance protein At4g27220 [Eucalyptus grandis]